MANSPLAVWSVFLSGILVALVLLAAFVAAVVFSQRRFLRLHRSHARKVLEAQEAERGWMSREVHDGAVQWVAHLERECEELATSAPSPETEERALAIRSELRDLAGFLRGLAHRIHPPIIDRGGLAVALETLCHEVGEDAGFEVKWEGPPGEIIALKPEAAVALYRIAQEALQNVVRHAEADAATVKLQVSPTAVELVVRDTGKGFEGDTRARARGIGLLSMKERAVLAGGMVEVKSAPGKGTEVRAIVPGSAGTETARMTRPRVVLVDDHHLMLQGIRAALEESCDIVAMVGSGEEGIRACRKHHPDLVLLDLSLPDQSGLEVIQELRGVAPKVKILVVTMHLDRVLADATIQSGARGFVPKDADVPELCHAVDEVLAGKVYISPLVPARQTYRSTNKLRFALAKLTPTQQRIMRLIGEGRSSEAIGKRLHLSTATITFHRARIRQALKLRDEWALLRHAILIRLSEAESRARSARSP